MMPSDILFISATLLLSLNFVRPMGFAISDWLYLGAVGSALLEIFFLKPQNMKYWSRNRFLWMAALVFLGALISTVNSRFLGAALEEIAQQIYVMTVFVSLIYVMVIRGKTRQIILAFIASGVFTACIAIIDSIAGTRLGPAFSGNPPLVLIGRYAGTLGHPNKLGYFLVLTTLLSIGYIISVSHINGGFYKKLLSYCAWVPVIFIQLFGIYLSVSLTAFLGLLLGLLAVAFSTQSLSKKSQRFFIIIIMAGILLVVLLVGFNYIYPSQAISNNIQQALDRVRTATAEARIDVYILALDRIIQNPLLGVGYDQISTAGTGLDRLVLGTPVHNIPLQIWYTGGIFALAGWMAIYLSIGISALNILKRKLTFSPLIKSLAAAGLSLMLMDQFQDSTSQREKWLVIGLLAAWTWARRKIHSVKPETQMEALPVSQPEGQTNSDQNPDFSSNPQSMSESFN